MPPKNNDPLPEADRIGAALPPAGPPLLPHEQDENIAAPAPPQPVMIQAQRDIARGLEDTDCYTRLGKLVARPRRK